MSARLFSLASLLGLIVLSAPGRAQTTTNNPPESVRTAVTTAPATPRTDAPTSPAQASQQMENAAIAAVNANNFPGAIDKLTEAIRLNPSNSGAYVLRASLYCQQKQWNLAEADFKTAQTLAPGNVALKFNIIEVKFLQKQYDAARPEYVALESDPDMGDFASYKAFLCDLAGGHEAAAAKDLNVFDKVDGNPSYYFGNAAWDLAHKKYDDARSWLTSASNIYPPRKNAYYTESLLYLGYLPLPGDAPASTSPAPATSGSRPPASP